MKFRTLFDGERAVLINRNGEVKHIDGPQRLFLVMTKMEKLLKITASHNQYLVLKKLNGEIEHIPGPTYKWHDRFEYQSILVKDALKLDDSQLIVIYNRDQKTKNVNRRVVKGPCMFIPASNEWLHEFKWHSVDTENLGHLDSRNVNKFHVLTIKPDFFHYNIKEVRTIDDTLISVKIMLIYELQDVNTMLDKTQDPISDFANAICADVISFVAKLTFAEFLQQSSVKLNDIKTYEQLNQRANRNGFKIESIIYNGYISSPELQAIQDQAIQSRTQLRLNNEIEKQKNELIDLKLQMNNKRFGLETELNMLKCKFEQQLNGERKNLNIDLLESKHLADLNLNNLENDANIEIKQIETHLEEDYLEKLKKLDININDYQLEMAKSKHKIDRLYQLVN